MTRLHRLACAALLLAVIPGHPAQALPEVTLWVIQPPGQLVAFDLSDFSRVGGVRIPAAAFNEPDRISINAHGQILARLDDDHLWLWDGTKEATLPTAPKAGGAPDSTSRKWLLANDGRSLIVLERSSRDARGPAPDTAGSSLRMSETDLSGRFRKQIFSTHLKPCRRPLRLVAFANPCPEPSLWAPGGTVRDCAVLTYWEQLPAVFADAPPQATFHRTRCLRNGRGWKFGALAAERWSEPLLDMNADGSAWMQAVDDNGCCGWMNGSSNQTTFSIHDSSEVVFDEWAMFDNQNFNFSFYTDDARIAPGSRRVALSVLSTSWPDPPHDVSLDRHVDSLQFSAMRATRANLPIVMVVDTRPKRTEILRVPNAELIGWASDSEILVLMNGRLVGIDVLTGHRRPSDIRLRSAADAFVVWR